MTTYTEKRVLILSLVCALFFSFSVLAEDEYGDGDIASQDAQKPIIKKRDEGQGPPASGSTQGENRAPTSSTDKPTKEEIEIKRQERSEQFQRNLENTIQKVGAKVDRPQDKDANGNPLAPEDIRHKDELKPEWELDAQSEKVTKAQQQALLNMGGTIEMPGVKKGAASDAEKKLEKVVKGLQAGNLTAEDKRRVELLIESYQSNPSDANANQIISQVVNIGDKVATTSAPAGAAITRV